METRASLTFQLNRGSRVFWNGRLTDGGCCQDLGESIRATRRASGAFTVSLHCRRRICFVSQERLSNHVFNTTS
jgi:hypothetical protein